MRDESPVAKAVTLWTTTVGAAVSGLVSFGLIPHLNRMLLTLNRVGLEAPLDDTGECLLLVELVLPRPAIARRAALKPIRLSKGRRSLRSSPFHERALLKEKVDGPFGLKVSVTRSLRHPQVARLAARLLAAGIEDLGGELAKLVPFGPAGELIDTLGETASDRLTNEDPHFIAAGGLDLDSEGLRPGLREIPLKLTETLRGSDLPPGPRSRERRRRQSRTYRKGTAVGSVTLDLGIQE